MRIALVSELSASFGFSRNINWCFRILSVKAAVFPANEILGFGHYPRLPIVYI